MRIKISTNSNTTPQKGRGVALIISVGVLAIMSLIAVSFAVNMQLEQKAAVNYLNSVKAECLAQAGIQKALADIRKWVKEQRYSTVVNNITANYPAENTTEVEVEGAGTYLVQIEDESVKVNINTLTDTDSAEIDKLLNDGGLSTGQVAKIIDYRDADGYETAKLYTSGGWVYCQGSEENAKNYNFATIEEIKLIADISDAAYEKVKDYITVYKPIVRGGLIARYYKGLNGTQIDKEKFLGKIVELGPIQKLDMDGAETDEESYDANFAGSYLFSRHPEWGNWRLDNFGLIYEGYIYIEPTEIGMPISFLLNGKDGGRLSIDNAIIVDKWSDGEGTAVGPATFDYSGWHPLKLEFYNVSGEQFIELQWKTTSFNHANCIPAERLGFDPSLGNSYNSAGIYKIISTGTAKSAAGNILAEEKLSGLIDIFGTWTVTERSEFSAAWDSVRENFSDGELKNVTWLDSCPTDKDETGASMNWDKSWNPTTRTADYDIINDSLKLGYWDNFGEDVAYSVVNVNAYASEYMNNDGSYSSDGSGWVVGHNEFDGDGQRTVANQLNIYCNARIARVAEVNTNYYFLNNSSIFGRIWEEDWGYDPTTATWGHSAAERNANPGGDFEPEAQWLAGYFSVKKDSTGVTYNVYMGDAHPPEYSGTGSSPWDYFEIFLRWPDWYPYVGCSYSLRKTLGFIMSQEDYFYACYLNGTYETGKEGSSDSNTQDLIRFHNLNASNCQGWVDLGLITNPIGASSASVVHFDNARVIFQNGYFASTPFYAGPNDISWGTISWTAPSILNTSIKMYIRAGSTVPTADTFSTEVINNSQLSGFTGDHIQFKAELSSTAFDRNSYENSSVTPVLEDVTITYLPRAEVLYWRNEMQ